MLTKTKLNEIVKKAFLEELGIPVSSSEWVTYLEWLGWDEAEESEVYELLKKAINLMKKYYGDNFFSYTPKGLDTCRIAEMHGVYKVLDDGEKVTVDELIDLIYLVARMELKVEIVKWLIKKQKPAGYVEVFFANGMSGEVSEETYEVVKEVLREKGMQVEDEEEIREFVKECLWENFFEFEGVKGLEVVWANLPTTGFKGIVYARAQDWESVKGEVKKVIEKALRKCIAERLSTQN